MLRKRSIDEVMQVEEPPQRPPPVQVAAEEEPSSREKRSLSELTQVDEPRPQAEEPLEVPPLQEEAEEPSDAQIAISRDASPEAESRASHPASLSHSAAAAALAALCSSGTTSGKAGKSTVVARPADPNRRLSLAAAVTQAEKLPTRAAVIRRKFLVDATPTQMVILAATFQLVPQPTLLQREIIADHLHLTVDSVTTWFRTRRILSAVLHA